MRFQTAINKRAALRSEFYYTRLMEYLFDEWEYTQRFNQVHQTGWAIVSLDGLGGEQDRYYSRLKSLTFNRFNCIISDLMDKGLLKVLNFENREASNLKFKLGDLKFKLTNPMKYIDEIKNKKNLQLAIRRASYG